MVVAIYAHPEAYPPTLNALDVLAKDYASVHVLFRPNLPSRRQYPGNVVLQPSGAEASVEQQAALPVIERYAMFVNYAADLRRLVAELKPQLIVLYDPLALLAYTLATPFLQGTRVWYHSHDVIDTQYLKRFSLAWFARGAELAMFAKLYLFTLPSKEREVFFPMGRLTGRYQFLPNLPSKHLIASPRTAPKRGESLRILFQGRISEGHGLEEIVELLASKLLPVPAELVLAGTVAPLFLGKLQRLIDKFGVAEQVRLTGYRPYSELHELTRSCHIGIAVYRGEDAMNRTVSTASNKIYEYAAAGLPILYWDSPHFRDHLAEYEWAVPWDGALSDLGDGIRKILENYAAMSQAAIRDCRERLNFEHAFSPVREFLVASGS